MSLLIRSVAPVESKAGAYQSDNDTMGSSEEIQLMIAAASGTGGLSRDAVESLGSLAMGIGGSQRRLEHVLENLDVKDPMELKKLRRMQASLERSEFLD